VINVQYRTPDGVARRKNPNPTPCLVPPQKPAGEQRQVCHGNQNGGLRYERIAGLAPEQGEADLPDAKDQGAKRQRSRRQDIYTQTPSITRHFPLIASTSSSPLSGASGRHQGLSPSFPQSQAAASDFIRPTFSSFGRTEENRSSSGGPPVGSPVGPYSRWWEKLGKLGDIAAELPDPPKIRVFSSSSACHWAARQRLGTSGA
jgi:hypothetical protein